MTPWIDTHCHLDAAEFDADRAVVRAQARAQGVALCVIPAVQVSNFDTVRELAHAQGDAYALGIHPLHVPQAQDADLAVLDAQLTRHRHDPRLVAVGEIGLDFFVPALCEPAMREQQEFFYTEQLTLARRHDLPVILHVRRSADRLLKGLRAQALGRPWLGIAHAFNGSVQQAQAFIALGLKLGFGGALSYQRALQLRRLASELPLEAIVLETDAPDMAPHWLYTTAQQRAAGIPQGRNTPAELPRIAQNLTDLRRCTTPSLADQTTRNALLALPRLAALLTT
jgi:TatD DNase family protein